MSFLKNLNPKNDLLYAGVEREDFELIRPQIREANRAMVTVLSAVATLLIFVMLIFAMKPAETGVSQNLFVYELGVVASLMLLILSETVAKKYTNIIMLLVRASYAIYYLYGILIGAVSDPGGKTVTYMVFLVFMPIVFVDRPIRVLGVTVMYNTIFIILCHINKMGSVMAVDIIDAVIFGFLGVIVGLVVAKIKVKGYVDAIKLREAQEKLEEISRMDQLTQMNNQNAYKLDLYEIPKKCKNSLACVYVDVNGLHNLNNECGHAEGDKLLIYVAEQMLYVFGREYSYRVGGDEFVAFVLNAQRDELVKKIEKFIEFVEDGGYSVSLGYEIKSTDTGRFSVDELVKAADERMNVEKKIFHREHDRV